MEGGDDGNLVIKKRFVTEAELDERRKRRQEEWEKVRKPEDPQGLWVYSLAFSLVVFNRSHQPCKADIYLNRDA